MKYSRQDDIVVGTPYANRDLPEVDSLVGAFVNTLALRLDLSGDPTFCELLCRAKEATAQAFKHGAAPFARVVEAVGSMRSAAFTPLYQARALTRLAAGFHKRDLAVQFNFDSLSSPSCCVLFRYSSVWPTPWWQQPMVLYIRLQELFRSQAAARH